MMKWRFTTISVKILVLVLNYEWPNKCVFTVFVAFFVYFFEVPSVKSSKLSQYFESGAIRILNTQIVGFVRAVFVFSISQICLSRCGKTGQIDFT